MYRGQQRCIQGFSGKLEGRRPLGRPRPRRENTIEIVIRDVR
jgi:hypothetical protein